MISKLNSPSSHHTTNLLNLFLYIRVDHMKFKNSTKLGPNKRKTAEVTGSKQNFLLIRTITILPHISHENASGDRLVEIVLKIEDLLILVARVFFAIIALVSDTKR